MSFKWKKSTFAELGEKADITKSGSISFSSTQGIHYHSIGGKHKITDGNLESTVLKKQKQNEKSRIEIKTNWENDFTPTSCDDLAVQKKKIEELSIWLQLYDEQQISNNPTPICVLTGPTGCGKTATLRVLADKYKFDIKEWINPIDQEQIIHIGNQLNAGYNIAQLEAFKSFLFRASRYKCVLQTKDTKRLLLVEDFPNSILHDGSSLTSILSDFVIYGKAPLIFICSEDKLGSNVFSATIIEQFHIKHINFNAISKLLLQKAIKRCSNALRTKMKMNKDYKEPDANALDSIVLNSQGDIRNALHNLHLTCLKGVSEESVHVTKSKSKKAKKMSAVNGELSFESGRQESISFLHGIARILNPKVSENGKFTHDPEKVSEIFITYPQKVLDLVHSNYLSNLTATDNLLEASDNLTLADVLLKSDYSHRLETNALGLDLIVRGMMVANTSPNSRWHAICGSKRFNAKNSSLAGCRDFSSFQCQYSQQLSKSLFVVDFASLAAIIMGKGIKESPPNDLCTS